MSRLVLNNLVTIIQLLLDLFFMQLQVRFSQMWLGVHTMLLLRYCARNMGRKLMFGQLESSFIYCWVEYHLFGLVYLLVHWLMCHLRFPQSLSDVLFFITETQQGIFDAVLKGVLDFDSDPWPLISDSAKDLIRKMLCPRPCDRLKAHEVLCKFVSLIYYIASSSFL